MAVLGRHLSPLNAKNVMERALRDTGLSATRLTPDDVRRLQPVFERSLRLYLPLGSVGDDVAEMTRAFKSSEPVAPRTIAIQSEPDISDARMAARAMCEQLGARRVTSQKVATIVSELARNIFMYTPGGTIELVPEAALPPRFIVRAIDRGTGIPNLDEIMSGHYRSRTGLGAGLVGTKRLAERFKIDTGPDGTRIEVRVEL